MESEPPPKFSSIKHPRFGGLKHLQRLLGLRTDDNLLRDAVFISFDLEVSSDREKLSLSTEKPIVREVAFARLDTRDLYTLSTSSDLRNLITVHMFQSQESPKSKKSKKAKQRDRVGRRCVFGPTRMITQKQIRPTIIQNLQISDDTSSHGSRLRDIVLVGHSIGEDLRILRYLDIDISSIAPILIIINTHTLSRFILPPYHPDLPTSREQNFSLAGVLAELGCQPQRSEFHNAGNDAVYSIYAMILLAIQDGTARMAECSIDELNNLETLRLMVFKEIEQDISGSRSAAQQASLWAEVTLGAGLSKLPSMLPATLTEQRT